jgi:hypothetical protein
MNSSQINLMECVRVNAPNQGFFMRLSEHVQHKHRLIGLAMLSLLLVACGGSDGQDPVLGTPSLAISPRVTQTTPAKLVPIVTGVATNSKLTATFSRDMLASSISASSFTVTCPTGGPYTGTITYDATRRLAILDHTPAFSTTTTCEAKLTKAITDTAGIPLAKDYVWSFTTGAGADATPPTLLVTRNPAIAAVGVCLSKTVSVTFSEAMDPSTIVAANFYVTAPGAGSPVMPGTITYDTLSSTATFAVTDPSGYASSTIYTTHVTTGVKDLAGLALAADNTQIFTTGTAACVAVAGVNLRTLAPFSAFGGGAGTTNSGLNTIVNGDLGTTAACTLFTGFHDGSNVYTETTSNVGEVTGDIFCAPPVPGTTAKLAIATQAATDALTVYNELAAITPTVLLGDGSGELGALGGAVLPGTYRPTPSTFKLTSGNLTLDAAGDANAIWVFQVPSSLTIGLVATPRRVLLINGAQAKNVFWQVGSAARIEDGSTMVGTIIASAGVTISTAGQTAQTTLTGRAIGLNASVTMVNTTIVAP